MLSQLPGRMPFQRLKSVAVRPSPRMSCLPAISSSFTSPLGTVPSTVIRTVSVWREATLWRRQKVQTPGRWCWLLEEQVGDCPGTLHLCRGAVPKRPCLQVTGPAWGVSVFCGCCIAVGLQANLAVTRLSWGGSGGCPW